MLVTTDIAFIDARFNYETFQSYRSQFSRWPKQWCFAFLLPYLKSVQTLVSCHFWLQCSRSLSQGRHRLLHLHHVKEAVHIWPLTFVKSEYQIERYIYLVRPCISLVAYSFFLLLLFHLPTLPWSTDCESFISTRLGGTDGTGIAMRVYS